jgi:hypothetical protein
MPLLPLEPYLYPVDLLAQADFEEGLWWVVHTRPRAEKALARRLVHNRHLVPPAFARMTQAGLMTPESGLLPGTPVTIDRGPFAGLEGTILRCGKQLNQGGSVEIHGWMRRPHGNVCLVRRA